MRFARITLVGFFLIAPAVVFAAPRTFQELAGTIVDLINLAIPVLILVGVVVYLYGVSTNILNFSDDSRGKLKAYFLWGIIILFVMVSVWGIVALLENTLFGRG